MRTITRAVWVMGIVAAAGLVFGQAAPLAAAANPSAGGLAKTKDQGANRSLNLRVIGHADGTASGHGILENDALGLRARLTMQKLTVIGNNAYIWAVVTDSNWPDAVGFGLVFRIQDNGEGRGTPDAISLAQFVPADALEQYTPEFMDQLPLLEVQTGNIQVRP